MCFGVDDHKEGGCTPVAIISNIARDDHFAGGVVASEDRRPPQYVTKKTEQRKPGVLVSE
jgi:hypothetical protein